MSPRPHLGTQAFSRPDALRSARSHTTHGAHSCMQEALSQSQGSSLKSRMPTSLSQEPPPQQGRDVLVHVHPQ